MRHNLAAREGAAAEALRLGAEIRAEYRRFEAEFDRHPQVAAIA